MKRSAPEHGRAKQRLLFRACGSDGFQDRESRAGERGGINMAIYRAEIEDDNFEIINAENEQDAIMQYMELGEEHEVFNLVELDDDYNEIRTVL